MKNKIYQTILCFFLFSSLCPMSSFASEVDELFGFPYSVEVFSLQMTDREVREFDNTDVQKAYNDFLILDSNIQNALITEYQLGNISYYEMQDVIAAYKSFVFYTQRVFYYISLEEKMHRSQTTRNAIYSAYVNMRTSYERVQNILEK